MAEGVGRWGGGAVRGAEELAWELAVEFEAAEAAGEWIAGAALDWRKAFDRAPPPAVSAALARAGVPDWIAGPVCSAYLAARRFRVDGALGEPWGARQWDPPRLRARH
eukprot:11167372-Lingulodinium_polyedra.AAC.1